jgi:hypothetical protein
MVTEELLPKITGFNAADDELVKRDPFRRLRKKAKVQARESRAARRTGSTPQRPRDEAQRRDWPFSKSSRIDSINTSGCCQTSGGPL